MSKNRNKIGIAVDKKINDELDAKNYNKSKLISSLLTKWLKIEKKDIKKFQKNNE